MPNILVGKQEPLTLSEDPAVDAVLFEEARTMMDQSPALAEIVRCAMVVGNGDFSRWKEKSDLIQARYGSLPPDHVVGNVLEEVYEALKLSERGDSRDLLSLLTEMMPLYISLYLWGRGSRPHFGLTSDFFEAMSVTDFGDPSDEPLYIPFDAFTLSFPPTPALGGASRIFVSKIPHVALAEYRQVPFKWESYRATLLTPDPVYTQWRAGLSRKELFAEMSLTVSYAGQKISEKEFSYVPRVRALVANVLSYIEASGDLPAQVREKKSPPQPVERTHPDRPLFEVGRVVKLDGKIRAALRESSGDKAKWALAQRFIVRGHWRNQAHGPGRRLRRRQWIEPHWKGPGDVVEAFDRTYAVSLP